MKKIIRVFPNRTSFTPDDEYVFIGMPPMPIFIPEHDEVHISCTFTWDKKYCEELAYQWEFVTNKPVKLGGPAYGSSAEDFIQGMYVKKNIIFTSRGCNNNCPWCLVRSREGRLKELPICEGNIIQDNNFLQTSKAHQRKVFDMLKKQHGICFKGGLEANLIDDFFIREIQNLSIKELWLACDTDGAIHQLEKACEKLHKAGFNRNKILCFALSYGKDLEKDEARCIKIYEAGAIPFVQLYQPPDDVKKEYSKEIKQFARQWQRPAIIKSRMKKLEEKK